jgi:membrane-associated phospholipid phosphatase
MNHTNKITIASDNDFDSRHPVASTHESPSVRPHTRTGPTWTTLSASVAALSVLCAAPCYAQGMHVVLEWNLIASNAAVAGGQNSVVQTRTFAMVQAAVHDALNAIDRRYELYVQAPILPIGGSPEAAVSTAAHDVLVALIPSQAESLNTAYATALSTIVDGPAKEIGTAAGQAAASAILTLRAADGAANANRPYTPGTEPGDYQPTTPGAPVVTPGWGDVVPFVLKDPAGFRPPRPYSIEHHQYAQDFGEVKLIGAAQSTERSAEQTQIARFWAEPMATMWNRIARTVAQQQGLGLWESARLLAVLDFALADATISAYAAKYVYNFWRPITAIRNADLDGNTDTDADPEWTSLLTASNHPEYPSAHSYQAASAAEALAAAFGDNAHFSIGSVTLPNVTRSFDSFSQAAAEIGESRIYGGIHFRLAVEVGLKRGAVIGRQVERQALRPKAF